MGFSTLRRSYGYTKQVGRTLVFCDECEAKSEKDENPDWKTYYKGQLRDGRKVYTLLVPGAKVVPSVYANGAKKGKKYVLVSISKRYSRKRWG